jgi:hypothetical protein
MTRKKLVSISTYEKAGLKQHSEAKPLCDDWWPEKEVSISAYTGKTEGLKYFHFRY